MLITGEGGGDCSIDGTNIKTKKSKNNFQKFFKKYKIKLFKKFGKGSWNSINCTKGDQTRFNFFLNALTLGKFQTVASSRQKQTKIF